MDESNDNPVPIINVYVMHLYLFDGDSFLGYQSVVTCFRAYSHQRRAFFLLRKFCCGGPIHTKDARFFCCGNSAADISKSHTFRWDPLADEVLEAA